MTKIQLITGTVNGNAWRAAETVAALLRKLGHQAEVNEETAAPDLTRDAQEILLICTSTTGDGELPRNLFPAYSALDNETVDLRGRRYGVIALGDRAYPRFAHAGLLMEDALYRAGAKRIGDVLMIDAQVTENAPLAAALWARDWILQAAP